MKSMETGSAIGLKNSTESTSGLADRSLGFWRVAIGAEERKGLEGDPPVSISSPELGVVFLPTRAEAFLKELSQTVEKTLPCRSPAVDRFRRSLTKSARSSSFWRARVRLRLHSWLRGPEVCSDREWSSSQIADCGCRPVRDQGWKDSVLVIVQILEPYHGRVLHPACGSGDISVQGPNSLSNNLPYCAHVMLAKIHNMLYLMDKNSF
jgi:hypothetical protein